MPSHADTLSTMRRIRLVLVVTAADAFHPKRNILQCGAFSVMVTIKITAASGS